MANTSNKFPLIGFDNNGNPVFDLFLPLNQSQKFNATYLSNLDNNSNKFIKTKYDMGISQGSYIQYLLKYNQHDISNQSGYTEYILGSSNSFNIKIKESGSGYTPNTLYPIKIYRTKTINNLNCWLCNIDNQICQDCNHILNIPIYAISDSAGKIFTIVIIPHYFINNKFVNSSKLLFKNYKNEVLTPEIISSGNITNAKVVVQINDNYFQPNLNVITNESGLISSNLLKKHKSSNETYNTNITIKKYKKLQKFSKLLYKNPQNTHKTQENVSFLDITNIDKYFKPKIRVKKQKSIMSNTSISGFGLSSSDLLNSQITNVLQQPQNNIESTISSSNYLDYIKYINNNITSYKSTTNNTISS